MQSRNFQQGSFNRGGGGFQARGGGGGFQARGGGVGAVEAAAVDDVDGRVIVKARSAVVLLPGLSAMAGPGSVAGSAAPPQISASPTGQTFGTAEEAVTVLVGTLRTDKPDALKTVLGPGSEKLVSSGDKYSDAAEQQKFLVAYDASHKLVPAQPDHMILQVGKNDWPFPIPLVQAAGRWHFDSPAGAQELERPGTAWSRSRATCARCWSPIPLIWGRY